MAESAVEAALVDGDSLRRDLHGLLVLPDCLGHPTACLVADPAAAIET